MICRNCGMQNSGDAMFCENCGTRLTAPAVPALNAQVTKKPVEAWLVIFLVEIAAAALGLFFLYQNVAKLFGAEKTGERYFAAAMSNDWEGAFELLEIEESEFINADAFVKVNQGRQAPIVNGYSAKEQTDFDQGLLGKVVLITYRVQGDSYDSTYSVSLNRQRKRKFLLFADWKVSSDSLISKEFGILVPTGAEVTVDDIALMPSCFHGTEEGHDHYVIPRLFSGMHEISVSMEGMETVTDRFDTFYDSEYRLYEMRASRESMQQALMTAGDALREIYTAALQGKKYDAIAGLFTSDASYGIPEDYREFMDFMRKEDGSRIDALAFDSISGTAESYMEDGHIVIEVYMPFDYSLTYTYEDYWDEAEKTDTYEGDDSVTFYFMEENGDWVLSHLGCHSLYY